MAQPVLTVLDLVKVVLARVSAPLVKGGDVVIMYRMSLYDSPE